MIRRWVSLGLVVLVLVGTGAFAFSPVPYINTDHPMAQRLLIWLVAQPPLAGGGTWYSLVGTRHGLLQNMQATGLGWQPTPRGGYAGELRLNGVNSAISFGSDAFYQFSDRTVTFAVRWRAFGTTGGSQYLVGGRYSTGAPDPGGYFVRILDSGEVNFRIIDASNGVVINMNTTATTALDGNVHTVVAVFRFDTTTAANNAVTTYYDGTAEVSGTGTGNPYSACPSCPFNIGSASDDPEAASLLGALLEFRLYEGALTARQAQTFHQQEGPSFGGLLESPPIVGNVLTLPIKRRVTIQ